MPTMTSDIANLLRPAVKTVFGLYDQYPAQWKEIFETYTSNLAVEIDVEMKYTGLAQIRPEGAQTATDTIGQRIVTNYVHRYVGLMFSITKQCIDDNQYKSVFP